MNPDDLDRDLQAHFDQQRASDQARLPDFETMAPLDPMPRVMPLRRRLVYSGLGVAAALILALFLYPNVPNDDLQPEIAFDELHTSIELCLSGSALMRWRSPTDGLLQPFPTFDLQP